MFAQRLFTLHDHTPLLVREASPTDAAALLALVKNVFGQAPYLLTSRAELEAEYSEESEAALLRTYAEQPGHLWLLAVLDGALVGTLNFANGHRQRNAHSGEFSVSVAPQHQGRGIGRCLLTALLDWAAAHPFLEKINLDVFASNEAALRLYQRLGFEESGRALRAIKFDNGTYDDVVHMHRFV